MDDQKSSPGGEDPIAEFMRQPVWAVVGASNDPSKWGHRIFQQLRRQGYRVYPVNPRATEVAGETAYPTLSALPVVPDVVDTVVPPAVTEQVVAEAARLGIRRIWMQPGSESARAIEIGETAGMTVVHDACVLVEGAAQRRHA